MDKKFDRKPVYRDNDKYIKIKLKIYDDNVNTSFQGKKVSKENAAYKSLSLIMLDSVVETKKTWSGNESNSETESDNESDDEFVNESEE